MSFVGEPFCHDIFISYSHGDPKGTGDSNLRQWSQKFWEELKRDLASYEDLGDLDIFFDASARSGDGVDPFDPLDKHLQEKAAASAMLLTLVSPYYMLSKYCGLERQWWAEGQTAHGFEARGRIAPALVWGIPQSGKADWPTALKEIGLEQTGVRFFDAARAKINPKPFGWPGIGERIADPKFHEALQTLVTHLRVHLLDFQARVRERNIAPAALLSGGEKPAIYLHGRSDNARKWDEACESLLSEGYPVFPENQRFFNPLLDVVGYLRQHLIEFKSIVSERAASVPRELDAGVKPSIYLHGRDDSPKLWDDAADALSNAGFPVSPDGPEPVEADAAKRARIREARVGTMAACDALVVVGPEDTTIF